MTILEELKKSELVTVSVTSLTTVEDSTFISKIEVEHSWHSSNVDALDMYDIVESEITTYEVLENLLMNNFDPNDFKFENSHILLRNNIAVVEKYLQLANHYIMDYLEYYDSKF